MAAKLTLKLDNTVIESAKRYAKEHNRSLSGIVENYFRNLSSDYNSPEKHSSITRSLTGVLSRNDLEKLAGEDDRVKYILRHEI